MHALFQLELRQRFQAQGQLAQCAQSIVKFVLRPLLAVVIILTSGSHVHARGKKVFAMDIIAFSVIIIHITALMRLLDSTCMNTILTTQQIPLLHILNDEQHTCDNINASFTYETDWRIHTT